MTYRQPFHGDYPITQRYGEVIPGVTYKGQPHTGIDYGCPEGTPILASADGTVMYSAYDPTGYGETIIILHELRKSTLYAHLSKRIALVNRIVRQGDIIGYSGSTGNATGPHLHFEAREKWCDFRTDRDPVAYLPLMNFAEDKPENPEETPQNPAETPQNLPAGVYKVACQYAFIRTWDALMRDRTLTRGERVYIFDDIKYNENGLPFRFIGAGRCIAEYDIDGTKILEPV